MIILGRDLHQGDNTLDLQFDNLLLSSLILYYENKLLKNGNAFTNVTSPFYLTSGDVNGLFTYACPFKPLVSDNSITNAVVMSGVYIGNTFQPLGSGGLTGINFAEGMVYLTGTATGTVSGNYAVQDFYITTTSRLEDDLLFERKYSVRPKKIFQSGLAPLQATDYTVPIIFLKHDRSINKEYALGGLEDTRSTVSCIIITDSQFLMDAVVSIIRDTTRDYVPELAIGDMPFNMLGSYMNNNKYNYSNLTAGKVAAASGYYIQNIDVLGFTRNAMLQKAIERINPKIYCNMLSIETSYIRQPRAC